MLNMSKYTIQQYAVRMANFGERAKVSVAKAQHEFAEMICEEVKAGAPVDTGAYRDSIKVSPTEWKGDTCITRIFSDMLVGGENPKWQNVPLGALLEWGTGSVGASSNTQNHGFPYRMTPWTYYNKRYERWITTNGMIARPHFLPPMLRHKKDYKKAMRKAVRQ